MPRFVVQLHDASTRHFDFRLELGGVLKSWAVPKGPSLNPSEKRMATPVEDHSIGYIDFEGVIPKGTYGGGTVIVWDAGSYENVTRKDGKEVPLEPALRNGHAVVRLEGEKLRGEWVLQRIAKGKDERWLLIKRDDEGADRRRKPEKTRLDSVKSGRTLAEIAKRGGG